MLSVDHDYHIHTALSTCCKDETMTIANIVKGLKAAGIKEACITDHMWERCVPGASEFYLPQDVEHVKQVLPLPQDDELRLFFGCETEFCGGTKLGITPASYDEFDFIIVPFTHLHNNFSRPVDCVTEEQVALLYMSLFEDLMMLPLPWHKVGIAHLTCGLTFPGETLYKVFQLLDEARLVAVFEKVKACGAGVELNGTTFLPGWEEHEEDFLRVYRIAKDIGCKFYCGSDAHRVVALDRVPKVMPEVIAKLGLTEKDQFRFA